MIKYYTPWWWKTSIFCVFVAIVVLKSKEKKEQAYHAHTAINCTLDIFVAKNIYFIYVYIYEGQFLAILNFRCEKRIIFVDLNGEEEIAIQKQKTLICTIKKNTLKLSLISSPVSFTGHLVHLQRYFFILTN